MVKIKLLILSFGLVMIGFTANYEIARQTDSYKNTDEFLQDQEIKRVDLRIEVVIEIPANSMPKNAFVTVGGSYGDCKLKYIAFQDDKISGNARKVSIPIGATFSYVDTIKVENIPTELTSGPKGLLTVEVMRKKKRQVLTYKFDWNKPTIVYFDGKKKQPFTVTVNAIRKVTID